MTEYITIESNNKSNECYDMQRTVREVFNSFPR